MQAAVPIARPLGQILHAISDPFRHTIGDDAQSPEPHRHRRSRRAAIPADVLRTAGQQEPYTGEAIPDAGNAAFSVLFDDTGLVLTLMKGRDDLQYPATFHIGFMQESEQRVNEMADRLRRDGYDADEPSRSHAWTFYVRAPGGFTVEVLC